MSITIDQAFVGSHGRGVNILELGLSTQFKTRQKHSGVDNNYEHKADTILVIKASIIFGSGSPLVLEG